MITVNDIVDTFELPDRVDFSLFDLMGRSAVEEMTQATKFMLYDSYIKGFERMFGSPVGYDLWLSRLPNQISAEIRLRVVRAQQ